MRMRYSFSMSLPSSSFIYCRDCFQVTALGVAGMDAVDLMVLGC